MPVKDRLSELDSTVNEISQYHGKNGVKYNKEAASVYGLLRETWEAFVEQNLLNDTVRRHDIDGHCQTNWVGPEESTIEGSQAASWHHSARAAERLSLKFSRL